MISSPRLLAWVMAGLLGGAAPLIPAMAGPLDSDLSAKDGVELQKDERDVGADREKDVGGGSKVKKTAAKTVGAAAATAIVGRKVSSGVRDHLPGGDSGE